MTDALNWYLSGMNLQAQEKYPGSTPCIRAVALDRSGKSGSVGGKGDGPCPVWRVTRMRSSHSTGPSRWETRTPLSGTAAASRSIFSAGTKKQSRPTTGRSTSTGKTLLSGSGKGMHCVPWRGTTAPAKPTRPRSCMHRRRWRPCWALAWLHSNVRITGKQQSIARRSSLSSLRTV